MYALPLCAIKVGDLLVDGREIEYVVVHEDDDWIELICDDGITFAGQSQTKMTVSLLALSMELDGEVI